MSAAASRADESTDDGRPSSSSVKASSRGKDKIFSPDTIGWRARTPRTPSKSPTLSFGAKTPWCSIILRKVFGVAGAAHMNASRVHYRYAWPSGDWGSLPIEGGIEAAFKADLENSDDPEKLLEEIEERMEKVRSPIRTAEAFLAEEIIDPRSTRKLLCEFANLAAPLRKIGKTSFGLRP